MRKLLKFILGFGLGCISHPQFAYAAYYSSAQQTIYYYAQRGNFAALKQLQYRGYPVDSTDQFGNSALCEAVYRKDYSTFAVLKQAGAALNHPCVSRIQAQSIQQFNQGYMNWANAVNARQINYAAAAHSTGRASATIVEASSGLSTAAVIGSAVGVAALVGGGIALAGGGGGGSSDNSQTPDPCANVVCEDTNSVCQAGQCVCKPGYDYHNTTTCHKTLTCHHGTQNGNKCVCDNGWTGTDCNTAASCPGYTIQGNQCPPNAVSCSFCQKGDTPYLKVDSCKYGWMGSTCQTPADCEGYTTDCGEGYDGTEACRSGTTPYYSCTPKNCEGQGYHTSCEPGYEATQKCLSGSIPYYSCTLIELNCHHGSQEGTQCVCDHGWNGTNCSEKNTCSGRGVLDYCPENAASCVPCLTTNDEPKYKISCKSNWTGSDTGCDTPRNCSGYELSECPVGATGCNECTSGNEPTKYSIQGCTTGYKMSNNTCICVGSATAVPHCQTEATCQKEGAIYHTCTACESGYNLWNNECVICPENYYAQGGQCYACPAHSTALANSTGPESCVCVSGYEKIDGVCHPIMTEAEKQKWKSYSKEEFESYSNYVKTKTLAPINAAQAYSKFILYNEDEDLFDYSALAPVKVVVDDTTGDVADSEYPYLDHDAINWATDGEGNRDFIGENNTQAIPSQYTDRDIVAFHGIYVASVIAAKWNRAENDYWGIAPNAQIYVLNRYRQKPTMLDAAFDSVTSKNPRVWNMSYAYGIDDPSTNTSLTDATIFLSRTPDLNMFKQLGKNNIVMVRAAGNNSNKNIPSLEHSAGNYTWSELGEEYSLKNLFITAVAATNQMQNNTLKSYSNACGWAQGWCLTAPVDTRTAALQSTGEWVCDDDQYCHMTSFNQTTSASFGGTSNATPVISGSVAFLMGAYPYMTSQQIVELLFRTANKTVFAPETWNDDGIWTDSFGNTYATSSLYGHGMVDLGAATEPQGVMSIPTNAGSANTMGSLMSINKVPVTATQLSLPRVLNSNLSVSLPTTIMGLDDYNRPFPLQTQGLIKQAHRSDQAFKTYFKSFMNRDQRTIAGVPDKMSFEFKPSSTNKNLLGMGVLDINYRFNDKASLVFAYRSDRLDEEKHFERALANPFLDMRDSYSLTQNFKPNKRWTFKFGATVGKNDFYEGDEDLNEEYNKSMKAFSSEVDYKLNGNFSLKFLGGLLSEQDSVLGMHGIGALETETSKTYFAGSGIIYKPVPKLTLSAVYYYGRTEMPESSGLVSFSDIMSDAFALDARYHFEENQMAGIQFSSPLRIKKGSAIFNIPTVRDLYSDTVYYDQMKVGLKPTAREYDLSFYYEKEAYYYDWRGELMARFHPDHMSDAKPDYRALFGLSLKY